MYSLYSWEVAQAQLNLMDSHDTAGTLWTVGGDESALRLCTLFQMTMPGAPCIYYGDEIGMTAGKDPLLPGCVSLAGPGRMGPRPPGFLPPGDRPAAS